MSIDYSDHQVEELAFECELTLPQARQVIHLGLNAVDPDVHQDSPAHLADPVVANAYFQAFVGAVPGEALWMLDAQVRRARRAGLDNAGISLAAAHAAEHRGDVEGWVAHLNESLRLDPQFEPARIDRAFAALLAGDRTAARRWLDGLEGFHAAVLSASLDLSEPIRARIGRNWPCPCGSGRKSKRCCRGSFLPRVVDERLMWFKLQMWLGRFPQDEVRLTLARELAEGACSDDDELLHAIACEQLAGSVALLDAGLLRRFTTTFGALLPPEDLATVSRWQGFGHRLWEVLQVDDGRTAEVVDVVGGEVRTILDDGESCCVIPGEVLYAAVLPVGDTWFMPTHLAVGACEVEEVADRIRAGDPPISIAVDVFEVIRQSW